MSAILIDDYEFGIEELDQALGRACEGCSPWEGLRTPEEVVERLTAEYDALSQLGAETLWRLYFEAAWIWLLRFDHGAATAAIVDIHDRDKPASVAKSIELAIIASFTQQPIAIRAWAWVESGLMSGRLKVGGE